MKIGINYTAYNDIAHLLYVLQSYPHHVNEDYNILFDTGEDQIIFSKNVSNLDNCDMLIMATINDYYENQWKNFDKIILSFPGEAIQTKWTDKRIMDFLNKNICMSSCNSGLSHPNLLFDYAFNLVYLYYFLGYNYVNFHDYKNEKTNLLGMYYNDKHVSGAIIPPRLEIFTTLREILQQDAFVYPKKTNKIADILEPYKFMGLWEKNHISTYTDFATSVCSLVFETNGIRDGKSHREHITEKTLKCILFSEANIFTLWYGSHSQIEYLRNKGFWFLNFEFYDEKSNDHMNIRNSIYSAAEYLKKMKAELGSNDKVYKHLLEQYGHKLRKNVEIFNNLLNTCENTNEIISKIKG